VVESGSAMWPHLALPSAARIFGIATVAVLAVWVFLKHKAIAAFGGALWDAVSKGSLRWFERKLQTVREPGPGRVASGAHQREDLPGNLSRLRKHAKTVKLNSKHDLSYEPLLTIVHPAPAKPTFIKRTCAIAYPRWRRRYARG